jgi:hypothetical protein
VARGELEEGAGTVREHHRLAESQNGFLSERIIDVKTNRSDNRINTTLGELIATVSEFAFEYSADTREAYDLAPLVLVELLKGAPPRNEIIDPLSRNYAPALTGFNAPYGESNQHNSFGTSSNNEQSVF